MGGEEVGEIDLVKKISDLRADTLAELNRINELERRVVALELVLWRVQPSKQVGEKKHSRVKE